MKMQIGEVSGGLYLQSLVDIRSLSPEAVEDIWRGRSRIYDHKDSQLIYSELLLCLIPPRSW